MTVNELIERLRLLSSYGKGEQLVYISTTPDDYPQYWDAKTVDEQDIFFEDPGGVVQRPEDIVSIEDGEVFEIERPVVAVRSY